MRRFRVGAVRGALFALTLVAGTTVVGTAASATSGGSASSTHATSGTSGTSGSVTSPQPLSSADQNPGGANNGGKCGNYCSTRDGSPSANGSGSGGGRPCAGCVGKADNKNPPGQFPSGGGSKAAGDPNNGYECDGNNGIAQGNPAHTGCQATAPTPAPASGPNTPPPATCPAGQTMVNGACKPAEVGGAQAAAPPGHAAAVLGNEQVRTGAPAAAAAAAAAPAPAKPAKVLASQQTRPAGLARTGADVGLLLLVAGILLVLGAAAHQADRRRRAAVRERA